MEFLIVDIDFAHFRLNSFSGLGLEGLTFFLFLDGVALGGDTGVGDETCRTE